MDLIQPNLYLGSMADLHNLEAYGITAVLTCQKEMREPKMRAYWRQRFSASTPYWYILGINDGEEIPEPMISLAIDTIDAWLAQGETVLVHCAMGVSRSPSIVIGYLMHLGHTFEDAYDHVHRSHPESGPHTLVLRSIKRFFMVYPYGAYDDDQNEESRSF